MSLYRGLPLKAALEFASRITPVLSPIWLRLSGLRLDRRAVTTLEYALVAGVICVVIVHGITTAAVGMKNTFATIASEL
jgi:Flp pilus assembly pilin Flp